jgi:hypothetical protein
MRIAWRTSSSNFGFSADEATAIIGTDWVVEIRFRLSWYTLAFSMLSPPLVDAFKAQRKNAFMRLNL